jgi:hypothetical protein
MLRGEMNGSVRLDEKGELVWNYVIDTGALMLGGLRSNPSAAARN